MGNGLATDFFCDNWLGSGALLSRLDLMPQFFPKVSNLIESSVWHLEDDGLCLSADLRSEVLTFDPCLSDCEDKKIWQGTSSGHFSVKSAWQLCRVQGVYNEVPDRISRVRTAPSAQFIG